MTTYKNAKLKENKKFTVKHKILIGLAALLILAAAAYGIYMLLWKPIAEEVSLEVGEEILLEHFLLEEQEKASFVTDVDSIDTSVLGQHEIVVKVRNRKFRSLLHIVDTTAPTADAVEVSTEAGTLPEAAACVTNIVDMTNVTVAYKEEPDVSTDGEVKAVVVLTDEGGNQTEVEVVISVWTDEEPPVIEGVTDKVVTKGGTVSYRQGVTVTDNKDENPSLEIDNSKVDLNKVGDYEVTYTATDKAGNTATATATISVVEKTNMQIDEATVNEQARKILNSITDSSMSDMEVAFAIYDWTKSHISYTNSSDKSNWIVGAYNAFKNRAGDCYNYFAAAKALFNVAGIDNVDVKKSDTSHSRHYWSLINIGTGWYHVDCTPRKGDGDLFFMVTDAELEAYSKAHSNSHIFDSDAYPARATKSVQSQVNY